MKRSKKNDQNPIGAAPKPELKLTPAHRTDGKKSGSISELHFLFIGKKGAGAVAEPAANNNNNNNNNNGPV